MSSKLRLGKGTRNTASLSEKQQIELAISLSLQQPQQPPQGSIHASTETESKDLEQQQAVVTIGSTEPTAANPQPGLQAGAPDTDATRTKRAAALRRKFSLEESSEDGEDSQGADDYEPEPSSSESEQDEDSDFAGDDSEDERPAKKRKPNTAGGKKAAGKLPAATKKATGGNKSAPAKKGVKAAAAGESFGGATNQRGRKPIGAPADAPCPLRPVKPSAATAPRGIPSATTVAARETGGMTRGAPSHRTIPVSTGPVAAAAREPADAQDGTGSNPAGVGTSGSPEHLRGIEEPESAGDEEHCPGGDGPSDPPTLPAAGAPVQRPPGPASLPPGRASTITSAKPVMKPATKLPDKALSLPTKPVAKPLGMASRQTSNLTSMSVPAKPPGTSTVRPPGGSSVSSGIKLPSGPVTYRVPGLRRPSSASRG